MKISCISIHNEQPEKEIAKTIPFTMAPKRIKYPGIKTMKTTNHCWKKLKTWINRKKSYAQELEQYYLKQLTNSMQAA